MLFLLSPSKTLDFEPLDYDQISVNVTQPRQLQDSEQLIEGLRQVKSPQIQSLMKVSQSIADLNVARFESFQTPFTQSNAKPAGFAFKGDVYRGLDFETLEGEQLDFAQGHARMLSGLYGLLRPMDLIQPYRLEMGTRFENQRGKNLYAFWGSQITEMINQDLEQTKSEAVINLASQEYFKSVKVKQLHKPVLNIHFKELRGDRYKIISFSAKYARGLMARFIIDRRLRDMDELKSFDIEGYDWNPGLSDEQNWVFTRPQPTPA